MKKLISSGLVVVLTFITVVAMFSFKTNYSFEVLDQADDKVYQNNKPDGTGFIFDDYDKNINIPVNQGSDSKESKKESEVKEEKGDKVNYNRYNRSKRLYEDYIAFNQSIPEDEIKNARYINDDTDLEKYAVKKDYSSRVENKITLEDKVYLAKVAKNLKLEDIDIIKEAISGGANDYEVRQIWSILKDRLPENEYNKVVEIISKYE